MKVLEEINNLRRFLESPTETFPRDLEIHAGMHVRQHALHVSAPEASEAFQYDLFIPLTLRLKSQSQ